jgi:hypothetical protein
MATLAAFDKVRKIEEHDRAQRAWIVRAQVGSDGVPKVVRVARVTAVWSYPRNDVPWCKIAVTDWGNSGIDGSDPLYYVGQGHGGDLVDAMIGATIGAVEVGGHCDSRNRPTMRDVCYKNGWEIIQ